MCLPNVTEHIAARLRRRDFLRLAGPAAAAGLFHAGEAIAANLAKIPERGATVFV